LRQVVGGEPFPTGMIVIAVTCVGAALVIVMGVLDCLFQVWPGRFGDD